MYRLGLKLWSINTDFYYDEAIRLYEDDVYDYIELYIVPGSLKQLAKWMELEIPINIHAPHFAHGFNLAKKEKVENNFEIYQEVKEFADALMAGYIVFHGGVEGTIEETARQLASFAEPRALIENKPYVALPHMGGAFCRGYNVAEIKTVIAEAGCGFCFDFGHAVCAAASKGVEPYKYIEDFVSAITPDLYHLTDVEDMDSEHDTHLHLGAGRLDLERIKKMLPVDAVITVETDKDSKEDLDDFFGDIRVMSGI